MIAPARTVIVTNEHTGQLADSMERYLFDKFPPSLAAWERFGPDGTTYKHGRNRMVQTALDSGREFALFVENDVEPMTGRVPIRDEQHRPLWITSNTDAWLTADGDIVVCRFDYGTPPDVRMWFDGLYHSPLWWARVAALKHLAGPPWFQQTNGRVCTDCKFFARLCREAGLSMRAAGLCHHEGRQSWVPSNVSPKREL